MSESEQVARNRARDALAAQAEAYEPGLGENVKAFVDTGAALISHINGPPLNSAAKPDDFFSVAPTVSDLYITELGKTVYIRSLNGRERDAYEASVIVGKGQQQTVNMRGARARLAALCLAHPDGTRMFTDKDVEKLNEMPAVVLERIFDRARKFNALTGEDTDAAEGNSAADRSGASISG